MLKKLVENFRSLPKKYRIGLIILVIFIIGVAIFNLQGSGEEKTAQDFRPFSLTPVDVSTTPQTGSQTTPSPTPRVSPTPTPEKPTPTPSPTPTAKTETISATAILDGFRSSNGGGNNGVDIRAGRNENLVSRGFVSFDLSSLPTGITIQKATLRLYQYKVTGDPYGVGGSAKIDHLNYGDSLGDEDYSASSISSSFATLTNNSAIEWKDADVTDRVRNDISNNRTRSQFRIHFQIESTGGDVTGDFAYFESAEGTGGTGNTPQLVVEYL